MNSGTAEQEQCEKNENNGKRGVQRPDEGFIDAEIHCFLEIFIRAFEHVLSNPVENNDGVMYTVTGDSENTGDK